MKESKYMFQAIHIWLSILNRYIFKQYQNVGPLLSRIQSISDLKSFIPFQLDEIKVSEMCIKMLSQGLKRTECNVYCDLTFIGTIVKIAG